MWRLLMRGFGLTLSTRVLSALCCDNGCHTVHIESVFTRKLKISTPLEDKPVDWIINFSEHLFDDLFVPLTSAAPKESFDRQQTRAGWQTGLLFGSQHAKVCDFENGSKVSQVGFPVGAVPQYFFTVPFFCRPLRISSSPITPFLGSK